TSVTSLTQTVASAAREARALQTPRQALAAWGDAARIDGAANPTMYFWRIVDGRKIHVVMSYGPAVKHPRRLEYIGLQCERMPSQETFREWLGAPASIGDGPIAGKSWLYGNKDKVGLAVRELWFIGPDNIWLILDGAPMK